MQPARGRRRDERESSLREAEAPGGLDMLDIGIGAALLILLPLLCYALSAVFAPHSKNQQAFRDRPPVQAAPDDEEISDRWKALDSLYRTNAKSLLGRATDESLDGLLRDHFRQWSMKCLQNVEAEIGVIDSLIHTHKMEARYAAYLAQMASMRRELAGDLERARALDILGRDRPR